MNERRILQLQSEGSESGDYKYILSRYLQYWPHIVISIILCLGLALVYMFYATPKYKITGTLLIKEDEKGADFSQNAVYSDLENYQSPKSSDNEVEVLKSKNLMKKVLTELSLFNSYYAEEGFLKYREIYGSELPVKVVYAKLDSNALVETKAIKLHIKDNTGFELEDENKILTYYKFGQKIHKPFGVFAIETTSSKIKFPQTILIEFHNKQRLINTYNEELVVEVANKNASIISLNLLASVPEKGKDILNKMIEVYNKEAVEDKNLTAINTIQFIDERLKYLTAELANVEKNVEQYKRKHDITDVSSEARLYLENTSEYKKQLSDLTIQVDVVESIEQYLLKQQGNYETVPSSLTIQDPTLLNLINNYNELQQERERMLRTTQPNNPLIQNLNERLASRRVSILENLSNIKKGLLIARKNLQDNSNRIVSKVQKVPLIERELLEINRQQGIKQEHYLYLLKKREESALSLAATTVSNSRIIDPATASLEPVKPQKPIILLIALVVGIALPIGLIYIKESLNDKVQQKEDIEHLITAAPLLGEISLNKDGNKVIAISESSRTPVAEQIRLIRTNLKFLTSGKNNVILITSSISGEGKTFFSLNLGASLSMTGKRVVILEFDLRKPALSQSLGLSNKSGISDYLRSDDAYTYDTAKLSQVVPNLYIAGSGPIPANPAELMMSHKVELMINALKEEFDHVIIDTAPVGQVADAFTLAPYVDSTIYMIRYNHTTKSQTDIIKDIHTKKKFHNFMIVLNGAKEKNSYGYGYGYKDDKPKRTFKSVLKQSYFNF
jgi:tyrosine-protein kinase Etk/Wzc